MLEDFIESNKIDAKIINFPTDLTIDHAIAKGIFPKNSSVKITLFTTPNNNPFITIIQSHAELDTKKIEELVGEEILEANEDESINITGYKKKNIPPISIFEIKVIIDISLQTKQYLFTRLSLKQFLKCSLSAIEEYNDEVIFDKITK